MGERGRQKRLLQGCWFPCICSNHNKNKMCIDSLRKKNEITRSLVLSLSLFLSFIVHIYIHIWWCICPVFSSSFCIENWMRLFCVKTIFTPHFLWSDSIEKLIIFVLMTGGNASFPFSRTSGQWTLIVCSSYHHFYLGSSSMNITSTSRLSLVQREYK